MSHPLEGSGHIPELTYDQEIHFISRPVSTKHHMRHPKKGISAIFIIKNNVQMVRSTFLNNSTKQFEVTCRDHE